MPCVPMLIFEVNVRCKKDAVIATNNNYQQYCRQEYSH